MAKEGLIVRWVRVLFDRASAKQVEDQLGASLATAGQKAGAGFMKELKAAFDREMGDLKVKLAKGLINPQEFKQQSEALAKQFNATVIKKLEEARAAGTLTDKEFLKLSRTLKRTGEEGATGFGRLTTSLKSLAATVGAFFAVSRITNFGRDIILAAENQEKSFLALEQQIKNLGMSYEGVREEVQRTTRTLWDTHRLTGGEVNTILQRLIFLTGDYRKSLENVGLVADVAAARQIDQATAADLVGKAINGNITALKKLGINAKDSAEALDILRTRSEGAAKAGTTATQALSKAWGEFKEELGAALLDATNGRSILDRLTTGIIGLTRHAGELIDRVVALTKALAVAGLAVAVYRVTAAVQAAGVAVTGLVAVFRGAMAAIGPTGWFVLAVGALAELFFLLGNNATEAAKKTAAALDQFKASLSDLNEEQLKDEQAVVLTRRLALQRELAQLRATKQGGPVTENKVTMAAAAKALADQKQREADIQRELNDLEARQNAIIAARQQRTATTGGTTTGGAGTPSGAAAGDDKIARERERIARELRVKLLEIEQGITADQAAEQVRREELLGQQAPQTFATLEEGWAKLAGLNTILAAGMQNDLQPAIKQTEQVMLTATDNMAAALEGLTQKNEVVTSQWVAGMATLEEEVKNNAGLIDALAESWATGSLGALGWFALGKVKENLARVIEETALAIGSFALGNAPSGAAHLKSAATHGAAAVAWKALSKGAGGTASTSAGAGGVVGGPAVYGSNRLQAQESEINIYLTGPGWDALNPTVQKVVYGAMERAQERFGQNAKIHVRRGG